MSTLPTIITDVKVIQKLGDNPNADDNLSADDLKKLFDFAGDTIKTFLNNSLIPALQSDLNALVATGAVKTAMIDDDAVTNDKLDSTANSEAVDTNVMKDGCVTTDKLDSLSVNTGKIADDAVTNDKLDSTVGSEAVDTNVIKDGAVTNAKLDSTEGSEAVDTNVIKDNAVTFDKLAGFTVFDVAANGKIKLSTTANSRALLITLSTASSSNCIYGISGNGSNTATAVGIANCGNFMTEGITGQIDILPANSTAKKCLLIVLSGTIAPR